MKVPNVLNELPWAIFCSGLTFAVRLVSDQEKRVLWHWHQIGTTFFMLVILFTLKRKNLPKKVYRLVELGSTLKTLSIICRIIYTWEFLQYTFAVSLLTLGPEYRLCFPITYFNFSGWIKLSGLNIAMLSHYKIGDEKKLKLGWKFTRFFWEVL